MTVSQGMGKLTEAHPKDVCECGDYRHQHDERGVCKFNKPGNVGHGGGANCDKFILSERHDALKTDEK